LLLSHLLSVTQTVRIIAIFWAELEFYSLSPERWVLVGKPEGKRPLGRPRHRWEVNIKVDLQEVGCGVWTGLSWLRIETGGRHL
jgi:hypothetical protein